MKKQFLAVLALSTVLSGAVKADEIDTRTPMMNRDFSDYQASELSSSEINSLWNRMRTGWRRKSVCQNRAHVWAYEMKHNDGIDALKAFMFYAPVYQDVINAGRKVHGLPEFIWYYHVAPAVLNDQGDVIVMDKAVTSPLQPKSIESWVSYAEVKMNKILNHPSSLAKVNALIAKYEKSRSNKFKAEKIKAMMKTARQADGSYNVKCKKIENVIDHDADGTNFCHYMTSTPYYTSQNDLRDVNYGKSCNWFRCKTKIVSDYSVYNQSLADIGKGNGWYGFNEYLFTAYDDAFDMSKKDLEKENIKIYPYEQ